jgi:omega-amidase
VIYIKIKAYFSKIIYYFNLPGTDYFSEYAEKIDNSKNTESPSVTAMQRMAIENSVYLIGGSIPEKEGDRLYNTSCVFNPEV